MYIGNTFNEKSIVDDLKKSMENTAVSLLITQFGSVSRAGEKRLHFVCDFTMTKTNEEIWIKHFTSESYDGTTRSEIDVFLATAEGQNRLDGQFQSDDIDMNITCTMMLR